VRIKALITHVCGARKRGGTKRGDWHGKLEVVVARTFPKAMLSCADFSTVMTQAQSELGSYQLR
jgi:hypothetical protein